MTTRHLAPNLLLAACSACACLATAEFALRLSSSGAGGGKGEGSQGAYLEPDALLGWRKRPGARAAYNRREYRTEVVINSLGLRDPERGYTARAGTSRILALGDSFVEAYGVPLGDSVTQVLERRLRDAGQRVDVINGGTAAYSTDQELLFYCSEGRKYAPRVVLVFFYYNDVLYNARNNAWGDAKPVFVETTAGLELTGVPVPPPAPGPPAAPAATARRQNGSALYEMVRERLMLGQPTFYNRLARLGLWPPIEPSPPPLQMKVYRTHPPFEIERAWRRTELILAALQAEVRADAGRLGLVYVPSRMEVNDRDWRLTQMRSAMDDDERWSRTAVALRVTDVANRLGVPLLDLTPALRAADHGITGGPYYVFDGHWNRRGHTVAAEAIAGFLRRAELASDAATTAPERHP